MKYVYVKELCGVCDTLENKLRAEGTKFIIRSGYRLSLPKSIMDHIDLEAFAQLQMQDLTFPVELDIVD